MQQISYGGQAAAMAGRERFWLVGELAQLDPDNPLRVWVTCMCAYARDILSGELAGPYDASRAERFARAVLMPEEEFLVVAHKPAREVADEFNVPIEQVDARAADLAVRLLDEQ